MMKGKLVAGRRFGIYSCLIDLNPNNDDFITPTMIAGQEIQRTPNQV
jgi:hypothetical protein